MNIFDSVHRYAEKWHVVDSRSFTKEEIEAVSTASVVDSQYGSSVCFLMRSGGQSYIPLSNTSSLSVGDSVNLENAKLLTLARAGESNIYRVEA